MKSVYFDFVELEHVNTGWDIRNSFQDVPKFSRWENLGKLWNVFDEERF